MIFLLVDGCAAVCVCVDAPIESPCCVTALADTVPVVISSLALEFFSCLFDTRLKFKLRNLLLLDIKIKDEPYEAR